MAERSEVPAAGPGPGAGAGDNSKRWLILVVISIAQLMGTLDLTVMNLALPSAQHALGFTTDGRQWIVTAYALPFGSLLLFSGRLSDLFGHKVTFLTGLVGFAVASAVGGASVNFTMLVTARASQGVFAALMAPASLALLAITFSDPKERGKAFAVFGSVGAGGSVLGLLIGGALTSYLSWRWCLYINLVFAGAAIIGGAALLTGHRRAVGARLDVPGMLTASGGMFCLVYGFASAATHSWGSPLTWGFLVAAVVLLVAFVFWQARAPQPLLPLWIVTDRTRAGGNIAMLVAGAGMFGIFLFLIYYMQVTLGYSPIISGVAMLPMMAGIAVASTVSSTRLMPRFGPRPLTIVGMILAAAAMVWLTRIGPHSGYAVALLGPIIVSGIGVGMVFAVTLNAGTYGITPSDAGVASGSIRTANQIGGSIGIALLNTIAAGATASYLASHLHGRPSPGLVQLAAIHGYTTVFWWCAGIFAVGAVMGLLLRSGPLAPPEAVPDRELSQVAPVAP